MAGVITIDEDIKQMNDFRYQCLVETFGVEEAKKIMAQDTDNDEITDKDLLDIIDNAGTLENDRQ